MDKWTKDRAVAAARTGTAAFTLLELLLVVSIIALLLTLLVPSLARARYRAHLVSCLGNQKNLVYGIHMFVTSNRDAYPRRDTIRYPKDGFKAQCFKLRGGIDDRNEIAHYFSHEGLDIVCPLSSELPILDASISSWQIENNISFWYGWQYLQSGKTGLEQANEKIGDGFTYAGRRFHVLTGDWVFQYKTGGIGFESAHLDTPPSMSVLRVRDNRFAYSRYESNRTTTVGQLDLNFGFDDGSVRQFDHVQFDPALGPDNDARFVQVPGYSYRCPPTIVTFLPAGI